MLPKRFDKTCLWRQCDKLSIQLYPKIQFLDRVAIYYFSVCPPTYSTIPTHSAFCKQQPKSGVDPTGTFCRAWDGWLQPPLSLTLFRNCMLFEMNNLCIFLDWTPAGDEIFKSFANLVHRGANFKIAKLFSLFPVIFKVRNCYSPMICERFNRVHIEMPVLESVLKSPTSPFTILELQNPSDDVPELHKISRSPDLEALKLWKCSSGQTGWTYPAIKY